MASASCLGTWLSYRPHRPPFYWPGSSLPSWLVVDFRLVLGPLGDICRLKAANINVPTLIMPKTTVIFWGVLIRLKGFGSDHPSVIPSKMSDPGMVVKWACESSKICSLQVLRYLTLGYHPRLLNLSLMTFSSYADLYYKHKALCNNQKYSNHIVIAYGVPNS